MEERSSLSNPSTRSPIPEARSAMRGNIEVKSWIAAIAALVVLVHAGAPAGAAAPLRFLPPDLDYKSVCTPRTAPLPALGRDWTQWHGEDVTDTADDMFALAGEYLRGSDR